MPKNSIAAGSREGIIYDGRGLFKTSQRGKNLSKIPDETGNMHRLAMARQVLKRRLKQHRTSRVVATLDHQHAFKATRDPDPKIEAVLSRDVRKRRSVPRGCVDVTGHEVDRA